MRVQLVFNLEDNSIPLYHRLGILAILKEFIRQGSESYYQEIFEHNKMNIKPFCYASYIPGLVIKDNQIFGKQLKLTISSPSYEFIMYLMNGRKKGEVYKIGNTKLLLKSKYLLPKREITSNVVTFKTLSPFHLENKQQKPLLATDEQFNQEVSFITNLVIREIYKRPVKQPIQVLQTMMRKEIIKEHLHQKQDRPLYLTANKGLIQIKGDPEDLQAIYEVGISARRSLGFGLLDVEEEVN